MQPLLSDQEQRWGEVLPQLRRERYWSSRAAMRQLLAPLLDLEPLRVPLHSPPGQPPQLSSACGWVSLSHAEAALLIGWSPLPIGVDLEAAARRFEAQALLQRFFPPLEQQQLALLEAEPLRQAVLRSWVVKEAAIKWRQRSIAEELSRWVFDHASGELWQLADDTRLRPREGLVAGWRWAAVGEGLEQLPSAPLTWPFTGGCCP